MINLSNKKLGIVFNVLVGGNFQVQRRWALSNSSRVIVVGSMARAKPSVVVAYGPTIKPTMRSISSHPETYKGFSLTSSIDRHTAKMCTHAKRNQPLRFQRTVSITLRVSQRTKLNAACLFYLRYTSTTNQAIIMQHTMKHISTYQPYGGEQTQAFLSISPSRKCPQGFYLVLPPETRAQAHQNSRSW